MENTKQLTPTVKTFHEARHVSYRSQKQNWRLQHF